MDPSVLARVVALLIASYCCTISCTSPTPPASNSEQAKYTKEYKKADTVKFNIRTVATVYMRFAQALFTIEIIALLLSETPKGVLPFHLDPSASRWNHLLYLPAKDSSLTTPIRAAGFAALVSGTALRFVCFKMLDKAFTFELALKDDHKLITYGPYAFVRHPSYTGGCVGMLGNILLALGPGSWWAERGMAGSPLTYLAGIVFAAYSLFFITSMVMRCSVEDDVLKAHFREEWTQWSKKTPYRLFPLLY